MALNLRAIPLIASIGLSLAQRHTSMPPVVARVNGRPIPRDEVDLRIAQSRSMDPDRFDHMSPEESSQALRRLLNSLVLRTLELQEAERRHIAIAEADVEKLFEAEASRHGGLAAFKRALAAAQSSPAEWKREMRQTLAIRKLESEVLRTPADRDQWLRELKNRAVIWVWEP